jgi:hypothetical protein
MIIIKKNNRKTRRYTKIDQTMLDAINKVYKADIEAVRNLSRYATYLMSGDAKGSGVTVPASLTSTTSLTSPIVNAVDINITGNLTINGTTINGDTLFDLMNTQIGTATGGGGGVILLLLSLYLLKILQ